MNQKTRREPRILDDALAALTRTTGLTAAIVTREPKRATGARPDATIQIEANGRRYRFLAEIKAVDRAVALATAKHQLEPHGDKGVLVTPYLTAELANHCRNELDLHFIDTAGNAYLRAPGLTSSSAASARRRAGQRRWALGAEAPSPPCESSSCSSATQDSSTHRKGSQPTVAGTRTATGRHVPQREAAYGSFSPGWRSPTGEDSSWAASQPLAKRRRHAFSMCCSLKV